MQVSMYFGSEDCLASIHSMELMKSVGILWWSICHRCHHYLVKKINEWMVNETCPSGMMRSLQQEWPFLYSLPSWLLDTVSEHPQRRKWGIIESWPNSSKALDCNSTSLENPLVALAAMVNSMYLLMLESRQVARWPKALTIILLANPETQVIRGNRCMYRMITKCSILVYCCNGCNILTVCW